MANIGEFKNLVTFASLSESDSTPSDHFNSINYIYSKLISNEWHVDIKINTKLIYIFWQKGKLWVSSNFRNLTSSTLTFFE